MGDFSRQAAEIVVTHQERVARREFPETPLLVSLMKVMATPSLWQEVISSAMPEIHALEARLGRMQ